MSLRSLLLDFERERLIKRTLRRLAKQRVLLLDVPERPWVIERAVSSSDIDVASALRTCHLRGWVEPIEKEPVPIVSLARNGVLPSTGFTPTHADVLYRLTEAGWTVIHNNQFWVLATFVASLAAAIAALAALPIRWHDYAQYVLRLFSKP